jgi:hypothetical protein
MMPSLSDTNEKINMKDHDILVSTHTLMGELMRRFEGYIETNNARIIQTEREMSEIAKNQIRLDSENVSIKGMVSALDERMDKLEVKSVRMDLIAYVGAVIAGLVAWLRN